MTFAIFRSNPSRGLPVYIEDVAEVGYGSANRFGAITGNGEGEKVLGQVMMIKNGNSNQVIQDVKKRVEQISDNLPEGVYINAFLERSELIGRTTKTVAENLILGCLIVIFVVVLLLWKLQVGPDRGFDNTDNHAFRAFTYEPFRH